MQPEAVLMESSKEGMEVCQEANQQWYFLVMTIQW